MAAPSSPNAPAAPVRHFGRFGLRRLLGRSAGTMVWLAFDPAAGAEVMLSLPRMQPTDAAALERWQGAVQRAARLDHPHLAPVAESGVHDHWPFVAVDRRHGVTLDEWLAQHPNPAPADVVGWVRDALHGLAFAHDAGAAHGDPQLHSLVIDERGRVRLMALSSAGAAPRAPTERNADRRAERPPASATAGLHTQRSAAARDLLALGLLLHRLLTGQPPLDQPDTALVIERMTPLGRELVRLPWATPRPVPEALRAIANRCTSAQERLRYQSPRTLLGALSGWLDAQSADGGGPVALLLDRLHTVGHLPALPGLAARVARVTSAEGQRTDEMADQVLDDMALSFELLRTLHSAQVQGTQVQGNGPVLTLRRIIALIGVNGVRLAANALRPWPGPLAPPQAAALQTALDRVRLAGHTAQALRPAGYDAQVVYLVAVLQNLGRLMLRYHFADEAAQIELLMKPGLAGSDPLVPAPPGLSEEAAAFAVLGADVDSLGAAVARQWGFDDDLMQMARRVPRDAVVRRPDGDAEMLRLTASAANDAVDAVELVGGPRAAAALGQIAQRYGRALGIGSRDLTSSLDAARAARRPSAASAADDRPERFAGAADANAADTEAAPR